MMEPDVVAARIERTGIIAVLRVDVTGAELLRLARTVVDAGIDCIELTLNSADAFTGVRALDQEFGGDVLVGAGTVRTADGARRAIEEGAKFLVSPHYGQDVSAVARSSHTLWLPGVFTATEVHTALAAGHEIVKLFPANLGGPSYMRNLLAPLEDARIVPTGGIGPGNARGYIAAGALAVGVGGRLTGGWPDADAVADAAKRLVQAVRDGRAESALG